MTFGLFDLILILIVASFVFSGVRLGLVHTLGALIGVAVGAYVATHYGDDISRWLAHTAHFNLQQLGRWVAFLVIFFVVARLVGFGFWLLEKTFGEVLHLPFLNSLNRALGGVLGFFEGALIIGLALFYARQLPVPEFASLIKHSTAAPYFINISKILLPLVPDALKHII